MKQECVELLRLLRLPCRLTKEQVAWILGFAPEHIPILVRLKLLRPLGHPMANGEKFFATSEILELGADPKWLAKASDALTQEWQVRNRRAKSRGGNQQTESVPGPATGSSS